MASINDVQPGWTYAELVLPPEKRPSADFLTREYPGSLPVILKEHERGPKAIMAGGPAIQVVSSPFYTYTQNGVLCFLTVDIFRSDALQWPPFAGVRTYCLPWEWYDADIANQRMGGFDMQGECPFPFWAISGLGTQDEDWPEWPPFGWDK